MTISDGSKQAMDTALGTGATKEIAEDLRTVASDETFTVEGELGLDGATVSGGFTATGAITASGSLEVTGTTEVGDTTLNGVVASNVTIYLKDAAGNALLAACATANIPTGAGYAKGCLLIATDGSGESNTLFSNIGDATTANFNAVTIAADA